MDIFGSFFYMRHLSRRGFTQALFSPLREVGMHNQNLMQTGLTKNLGVGLIKASSGVVWCGSNQKQEAKYSIGHSG